MQCQAIARLEHRFVQVLSRRNWTEIEAEVEPGLVRVERSHHALRQELNIGLAKALMHLGRPADKVVAAADVRFDLFAFLSSYYRQSLDFGAIAPLHGVCTVMLTCHIEQHI